MIKKSLRWAVVAVTAGVLSALHIVVEASYAYISESYASAMTFALVMLGVSVWVNGRFLLRPVENTPEILATASRTNALLMAGTFLWGAVTLLGVYTLSGLWWWHSWQYGLLMFAIANALFFYARAIGAPAHPFRAPKLLDAGAALALFQGLGAAGGLYFLISSGKLASIKPDWPANHVFLALGIAICGLSLMAALTHFRLRTRT